MTEKTYTAADFAVAEFAKHPDGSLAVRMHPDYPMPWRVVAGSQPIWFAGDYDMAEEGWVPVPSSLEKPTITESRRDDLIRGLSLPQRAAFHEGMWAVGGTVVPDPEPTNTEHDSGWWIENANTGDAEDCEACGETDNQCPVHYGVAVGIDLVVRKLAALGDDPELFARIPDPVPASGGECRE